MDNSLKVVYRPIASLIPYARNARTHPEEQIEAIARSIGAFGFTKPVLVVGKGVIIAGHATVLAAKRRGMKTVPTICLDHLSEEQKRAYIIADNRLAELAGWDRELLAIELEELAEIDIDIDVTLTGFSIPEIDVIIEEAADRPDAEDPVPLPSDDVPAVTRPGDLWLLSPHRLFCGDARNEANLARLMAGEKAQMVFVDPPYNVKIDGHVCGLGAIKHDNFAMAVGEMSPEEYIAFLWAALTQLARHSEDGSLHYICIDWRHLRELLAAAYAVYTEHKNLCVWNKTNGGMGSLYRSKHELISVHKNGTAPHLNNVALGRHGRNRTNVWDYAGVNSFREGRLEELAAHPTAKPVALVADAILDASKRNGIVLDSFVGSGTTFLAAERVGRRGYGLELDPRYVDVALGRWAKATGAEPVHAASGLTFEEVARRRRVVGDETEVRSDG